MSDRNRTGGVWGTVVPRCFRGMVLEGVKTPSKEERSDDSISCREHKTKADASAAVFVLSDRNRTGGVWGTVVPRCFRGMVLEGVETPSKEERSDDSISCREHNLKQADEACFYFINIPLHTYPLINFNLYGILDRKLVMLFKHFKKGHYHG
ncbi:MAG: hypothetical protein PHE24_01125 [Patescibacteria group bacterium]|nr:hypothetical protein [Patescibacteria group bacterium]